MDKLTPEQRSAHMRRIRSKDTKPELAVRKLLHGLGYRFRLHRRDLPGRPDIVLPRHKKIILVHGCFWHGHGCRLSNEPKSNQNYWSTKIEKNRARDSRNREALENLGWRTLELWECETQKAEQLLTHLIAFMEDG